MDDLSDLICHEPTNPTIAPYAKMAEVTLRVTASAANEIGETLIQDTVDKILARDGQYFYGYGDDNSLANVVVNQLIDRKLSITAAESLTAGEFQKHDWKCSRCFSRFSRRICDVRERSQTSVAFDPV